MQTNQTNLQTFEKACPICFGSGFLLQGDNNQVKCNHCDSTGKVTRRVDRRTRTGFEKLWSEKEQV